MCYGEKKEVDRAVLEEVEKLKEELEEKNKRIRILEPGAVLE